MTDKKILEENIIPHLKSLKERAIKLKNEANEWQISLTYKQGFPKYEIVNILVEILLGEIAINKINELVGKSPSSLGIKYLFQYELNFLYGRLGLMQAGVEVNLEKGNTNFWDSVHQYAEDWEECLIILEHLSFLLFKKENEEALSKDIISKLKHVEMIAEKLKSETNKWELLAEYKEPKRTRYRPFYRILNLIVGHDIFYNLKDLFEENKSQLAFRFQREFSKISDECKFLRKVIEKKQDEVGSQENFREYAEDWEECLIILEHLSFLLFKKKATS